MIITLGEGVLGTVLALNALVHTEHGWTFDAALLAVDGICLQVHRAYRRRAARGRILEGLATVSTATVLSVAVPLSGFVLALYAIGSVILRQRDPFILLLLAGTAGVLVLAVFCAETGLSMSWCWWC